MSYTTINQIETFLFNYSLTAARNNANESILKNTVCSFPFIGSALYCCVTLITLQARADSRSTFHPNFISLPYLKSSWEMHWNRYKHAYYWFSNIQNRIWNFVLRSCFYDKTNNRLRSVSTHTFPRARINTKRHCSKLLSATLDGIGTLWIAVYVQLIPTVWTMWKTQNNIRMYYH